VGSRVCGVVVGVVGRKVGGGRVGGERLGGIGSFASQFRL